MGIYMINKRLIFLMLVLSIFFVCIIPFGSAASNIIIVRPKAGQVFTAGNNVITWEPPEDLKSVKIDLYKSQQIRKSLDMYTSNDGEYIWYINRTSDHFVNGNDYQIRITGITDASISGMSSQFTIKIKLPFIMPETSVIIVIIAITILFVLIVIFYEKKTHKIKRWREKVKTSIRKRKRMRLYKRKVKARNNN